MRGAGPARILLTGALITSLSMLVGCEDGGGTPSAPEPEVQEGGAAGGQLESSMSGWLSRTYRCEQQECIDATKVALANLQLIVHEESGAIFRRVFETTSEEDGTNAIIEVSDLTKETSRIGIKVGYLLGNEDASRRIHSEILSVLESETAVRQEKKKKWTGLSGLVVLPAPSPTEAEPPEATAEADGEEDG